MSPLPALPDNIALLPGEAPRAIIRPDWGVRMLTDALLVCLGMIAATCAVIALDGSFARGITAVLGSGLTTTFVFLLGPLAVQRILGLRIPYVLTDRRLILAEDDAIDLRKIRRMRVWLTSISIQTDTRNVALRHLVNPPAVARLIRETVAR